MMEEDHPEAVVESLRLERLNVQKKTFTKWANIHLQKYGLQIDDLFQDLGDGLRLMKLLESLTGEKLGKPAKGNARIKKIENISRCLMFLHSKKMRLENISSEDIVDGKPHLILGLMWTIILRCEIWQHQQSVSDSEGVSAFIPQPSNHQHFPVQKIAKDTLLLWCQTKTDGYPGVYVRDFHRSWRDGLAFNALIHSHLPTLVDFCSLKPHEHIYNLGNAFDIASKYIGVPKLLDPEDVDTDNPDEKSILVYVSTFSKGLGNVKKGITGIKRIANVLAKVIELDSLKEEYNSAARELLRWINSKVEGFTVMETPKSLEDLQKEISNFKDYRTKEKPQKYDMKNEIEALLFAIQMRRMGTTGWNPPEDVSIAEIERTWRHLEKAEHEHEIQIRVALKEQERMENLAYKFDTKRSVREGYLEEMQKVLTDPNYGANIKQVDATFKKHEGIRAGILSREIMIKDLFKTADILIESNYRRKNEIIEWKMETEEKWKYLLRLLEAYDERFDHLRQVIKTLEEIDSILEEMKQMQAEMNAEKDPLDVEHSLQKQAVREVQISSWGEAVRRLEAKVEKQEKINKENVLHKQLNKLRQSYQDLVETSSFQRDRLDELLKRKQQLESLEEVMAWISEKQLLCSTELNCKDLAGALLIQKKHKSLGLEMRLRKERSEDIQNARLLKAFSELDSLWEKRASEIELAIQVYQYEGDAYDCSRWISEKLNLLSSVDCGSDELTCDALLRRHAPVEREISTFTEVTRLLEKCEELCNLLPKDQQDVKFALRTGPRTSRQTAFSAPKDTTRSQKMIRDIQSQLEKSFEELKSLCQERRNQLQHSKMFYRFKDGCEEMEMWMRQKELIMDTNDFGNQAEEVENYFEAFITDLAAHGLALEELRNLAHTLQTEKAEKAQTAAILLNDVERRWQHLNEQTRLKEKNLKGFTSLLLARRMCDEISAWLNEQCESDEVDSAEDIKSFEALRRKQDAVGRELVAAEERVKQAFVLAENVADSYPDQRISMKSRIRKLEDIWVSFQIKVEERKRKIEESAGLQIFKSSANALAEWTNMMVRKLSVREKISDMGVAESVAKDHRELGDEIEAQEERFSEAENLGLKVLQQHPDVRPLLKQMEEARNTVHELWKDKQNWLRQSLDLHIFNREADQLHSICASQDTLLEAADMGDTLSDVEILKRHHDAFVVTLKAQDSRFDAFNAMAENLINAEHCEKEYISARRDQVLKFRQNIKEKSEMRKQLLQHEFRFQQFKVCAQEISAWTAEKNKFAIELLKQDAITNLSYKMKRQQTFEAELSANQKRLQSVITKGEKLLEESDYSRDSIISILDELSNAWNVLVERMEINRHALQRAKELSDFHSSVETVEKKIEDIHSAAVSTNYGGDLRSVKRLLKSQETLENEKDKTKQKVQELVQKGKELIRQENLAEERLQNLIEEMQQKMDTAEIPVLTRRKNLEKCLKFYQFQSEVDRELEWISEHMNAVCADMSCRNLVEALKRQKKIENLEVTLENHKLVIEKLLEESLLLIADEAPPININESCKTMEKDWNKLLETFNAKKEKVSAAMKAQMFYSEAGEIDAWISEKTQILSNSDYGKDEDAVILLLTKQKALELEIDSFKGLVDEVKNQGKVLVDSEHPESKIIKNRIDVIDQEMRNIEKLCTIRRQKLLESKNQHEFEKETEELKVWISEQMVLATSDEYGEDYEHVLLLHRNFEFFRTKVEAGSKRVLQYEDFAKRLIDSNCLFIEDVQSSLSYLSARWSELLERVEARAFKLEAAAEIHRYHRDVTDILSRIHSYYRSTPHDLGNNLNHVQDLLKKHDKIENELLGLEAQVHLLLEDSQRLQDAYPGGNEEHIQMQLALVIENWNLLQQKEANRKIQLLTSQRIHKFLSSVKEEESWVRLTCVELDSDITYRDLEQMENDHRILGVDIETRLSHFPVLHEEGQSLLSFDLFRPQIEEKLKSLIELEKKIQESWDKRSKFIQQKKDAFLFFNEAKQIQSLYVKREVQLCGSETKETVEDIENALKKHSEFQKSMDMQEEKFLSWKQQGEELLKLKVEESPKIQKKIHDLSARRKRLLDFSSERSKTLTEALQHAEFKRDTIEAESWIQEKRNKLRVVLKNYKELSAEEKIKCLQKQQTIQAELDAHEPIISRLREQDKKLNLSGEELKLRLQLILEDWEQIREDISNMGNDLAEVRDVLTIRCHFEKAESWIKEKELMIQANDVGNDLEHCIALQNKLSDLTTDVSQSFMKEIENLARKLSRKDHQKGIYIQYEKIYERWLWVKEEMQIYSRKLKDAAEVHAFVKDVDDVVERIREKTLILSSREEVKELNVVEVMQKKLERIEQDLTTLEVKKKEQQIQAKYLTEKHELSARRIHDKINEAEREWSTLIEELNSKKKYIDSAYASLRFVQNVNDFAKIVKETITEMEYGDVPEDSADAQSLLRAHNDLYKQIVTRQEEIKCLQEKGKNVLRLPGVPVKEVEYSMDCLQDMYDDLETSWDSRKKFLTKCKDMQSFTDKAKQIENWLSLKEAFLANQDIGDSLSSVEALIWKHNNFEDSCFAHLQKIKELEVMSNDLRNHEDYEIIEAWCNEISQRKDALQIACKRRRDLLEDAKILQQFLLDLYEITNWMEEKIRVISDESYKDLTNLLSKSQKHAAFEAEILANFSRVVKITEQAENLLQAGHFASAEIREHIGNVENLWGKLMDSTNEQKECLKDACNALQFKHKLDDVNSWLDETEIKLQTDDYNCDVASIQEEINKLQELEKEGEEYSQNLLLLNAFVENFQKSSYFSKNEMISSYKTTLQRFRQTEEHIQEKFSKLQEDLFLAELESDINDELSWIKENTVVCDSEEYFDDVMSVQALQKKLQALETEIFSREPLISSVVERGNRSNNPSAESKVIYLEQQFQELKDSVSLRRLRLADALEAQTFYFEVNQAEVWMKEKLAQVKSYDAERDIYSVQAAQKKLTANEAAIDGFRQNLLALQELSSKLLERRHFDSQNIQLKQEEINDHYEQLRQATLKQTAILRDKESYFLFERDIKTLISQLKSMTNVAKSTDYGRDVEHVENLLQKFEVFQNKLRGYEDNVLILQQRARSLIEEGHEESENVEQHLTDLEAEWLQCNEAAEFRHKTLTSAKVIHAFNKSVDETMSWIYEKDVSLSSEDYGHDYESIKTLLKHHDTLEIDLKAIEEQVKALEEELASLSHQFPEKKIEIEDKYETLTDSWRKCTEKAAKRKDKLQQSEKLQSYFDEARDFHAWIHEMSALITSKELPKDLSACESLLAQHEGYKSDIEARKSAFLLFKTRGEEIISTGHFMTHEINSKIQDLSSSLKGLMQTWEERRSTYEQVLDLLLFKKKLKELETWLQGQEHNLALDDGGSVEEVEYLIRKHEEFEKKIKMQEDKFQELIETTKIEEDICRKKEEEERRQVQVEKQIEQEKIDEIKRREEERLLVDRQKERTESEISISQEVDYDFLPLDSLPSEEQVFKRMGSRRSFIDKRPDMRRSSTPVIFKEKLRIPGKPQTPPTTAEGFLERKIELQSGGKRLTSRKWKRYYTVLCGQLLCFFKDKKSFIDPNAAKPPINILGANCTVPTDYHKKKYVFRLEHTDQSSYLFEAPSEIKRDEWIQKINFTASLPPSMQLMNSAEKRSFEEEEKAFDEYRLYDVPHEETERTISVTSDDGIPHSARSSLSNQSSYKTAVASTVSISTLQDDHDELSEDEDLYTMPSSTPRGSEISIDNEQHEQIKKHASLPREIEHPHKRTESKKKWKVFSLRRN